MIVQGDKIERVGPAREIAIPSGAILIEGRGKYLLPGLADMHVHLAVAADPPGTAESELILFLANGITTVRNMLAFPGHLTLRDKVANGEIPGPDIITAGRGLDGDSVKSPAAGEAAVREQKRQGYDLIKVLPGPVARVVRCNRDNCQRGGHSFRRTYSGGMSKPASLTLDSEANCRSNTWTATLRVAESVHADRSGQKMLDVVRRYRRQGRLECSNDGGDGGEPWNLRYCHLAYSAGAPISA